MITLKRELAQAEIEKRFAKINAQEPEKLTPEDTASLAEAEAMNDGTTITLEEFEKTLSEYSGKLVLRIPRSLHKDLKAEAEVEGGSLNQ